MISVERLRQLIERMRQREAKFVWRYGCSSAAPPDSEIKRWTDELESILEALLSACTCNEEQGMPVYSPMCPNSVHSGRAIKNALLSAPAGRKEEK